MNIEEVKRLIDEYLETLPNNDGDEWYGDYRYFAHTILLGNWHDGTFDAESQYPSFLKWLESRNQ